MWTESGKERIGFFSRALDCIYKEREREAPGAVRDDWLRYHMEAESLYEIARVHAHEAAPEAARRFLEQALPLARLSDAAAQAKAKLGGVPGGLLEGKITALLLQLPDGDEEAFD